MAGVAQVWLTEDELDFLVKAAVRYLPKLGPNVHDPAAMATRQAVLDKLRPLAYGTSCDAASGGGCSLELETKRPDRSGQTILGTESPLSFPEQERAA